MKNSIFLVLTIVANPYIVDTRLQSHESDESVVGLSSDLLKSSVGFTLL